MRISKPLGFLSPMLSITATELCHCCTKAVINNKLMSMARFQKNVIYGHRSLNFIQCTQAQNINLLLTLFNHKNY